MPFAPFGQDLRLDPFEVEREVSFPGGKLDEAAILGADIEPRETCFSP